MNDSPENQPSAPTLTNVVVGAAFDQSTNGSASDEGFFDAENVLGVSSSLGGTMAANHLIIAFLGGVMASSGAQPAQQPQPTEEKIKICRKAEMRTGTRIRAGRRCRTAEEWQKEDEEKDRIPLSLTVTEGQNDGHPPQRPQ